MFHVEQMGEQIQAGAKALGLSVDVAAARGMAIQLEMLDQWNAKLNLVGPGEPSVWMNRHSLDSLVAVEVIPDHADVLDVGSGAGFPGIPLALARPDSRFRLAERRSKRRAFLQNVVASVGARNVTVIPEAEAGRSCDVVLGRAVLPAAKWLPYAARFASPGGLVGLFAQEQAGQSEALAKAAGLQLAGERTYVLSGEPSRRFSWFRRDVPRETT
jgi:16S rRNA (guanine527-N7)-methyltransferase